jgi:hypothetical protein
VELLTNSLHSSSSQIFNIYGYIICMELPLNVLPFDQDFGYQHLFSELIDQNITKKKTRTFFLVSADSKNIDRSFLFPIHAIKPVL